MAALWQDLLQWTEATVAVALLYFRFCLYETEEGHLQNVLVETWVRLSDQTRRLERMLAGSAQLTRRFFDALLGPRLVSLRSISISGCLLYLSARISTAVQQPGYDAYRRHDEHDLIIQVGVLVTIAFVLLIPMAPLFLRKWRWPVYIPIGLFLLSQIALIVAASVTGLTAIWVAIVVDCSWLAIVRRGTDWALETGTIARHLLVVVGSVVATVAFFFILPGRQHPGMLGFGPLSSYPPAIASIILFQSDARFFIAGISLIQLSLFTLSLLNLVVWQALSRVVYAAERYQFFRKRKLFATCGVALLIHVAGGSAWAKQFAELLGKSI